MSVERVIREYYESLRRGEPLAPYFRETDGVVKFGVSDSLYGFAEVTDALREQNRTTDDWTVESDRLTVSERDEYAWFADEVDLAWTDLETGSRREFDTRWSGTLERVDEAETWLFVSMHVSAPEEP